MTDLEERIDSVLRRHRWQEWLICALLALLFLAGLAFVAAALMSGDYGWSIPTAVTTFFLKWPLAWLMKIRRENVALGVAPAVIAALPEAEATRQLIKMLEALFGPEGESA
jgi:hypothetical protein